MERLSDKVNSCWITLNRKCNFRCTWCYAQGEDYSDEKNMNFDDAVKAVDLAFDLGIRNISLIGGEPTLWNGLGKIIPYASKKSIKIGLITNGLVFASKTYLLKLIKAGLSSINLSIKGGNAEEYENNTGRDSYNDIKSAVKNIIETKIPHVLSYVLTNNNIDGFVNDMEQFKRLGTNNFYFSFCNSGDDKINANPLELVRGFETQYDNLESKGFNFVLHQSLPNCLWDSTILQKMNKNKRLKTVCQLHSKSGLVFGTKLELYYCNMLYQHPYGQHGIDYNNAKELVKFLNDNKVKNSYKELLKTPFNKCVECADFKDCGGGCVLQWKQIYNIAQLKKVMLPFINVCMRGYGKTPKIAMHNCDCDDCGAACDCWN